MRKIVRAAILMSTCTAWSLSASGADTEVQKAPERDNSKVNQRDQDSQKLTADQQSNADADVEVVRSIRQALVKDKKLSTYAHNVKIISEDGGVVLRGPVRSAAEKKQVEALAAKVAAKVKVRSELEIASH